jgi:two-component system chemotaxis sensor kinase CheA
MNNEELAKLLKATYQQELHDHVGSLTRELLAMESAQSPEQKAESWQKVFRVAHTLKGASGIVNIDSIRDACHAMEEIFARYRDADVAMPEQMTSLMLKAIDGFTDIGTQLQTDQDLDESFLTDLLPELQKHAENARNQKKLPTADMCDDIELDDDDDAAAVAPVSVANPANINPSSSSDWALAEKTGPDSRASERPVPDKTRATTVAFEPASSVRVPAQKLDSLLSHSGELLIARGRMALRVKDAVELSDCAANLRSHWKLLQHSVGDLSPTGATMDQCMTLVKQTGEQISELTKRLDRLSTGMESDDRLLNQTCGRLDDEVYRVRMLPFSEACVGLDRVVRDVAKASGKLIRFKIEGADVEVDRSVLEGLKDPLLHLVRNAVDHGIESPEERVAAGKPEQATVTVSAALRGGQVEVMVADDGGGFDLDRICKIAKQQGLEVPEDPRQQARLVLNPGFSTAKMITDISGRGIGMDVVQSQIESLHGELEIDFDVGKWSRFTMNLPLTLTTIRCMLIRTGNQKFAIPTSAINRLVRFTPDNVRPIAGRDTLFLDDSPVTLVRLAEPLGLGPLGVKHNPTRNGDSQICVALVMSADGQQVAAVVDEVVSEQEVLVKNLGTRIKRLKHFSGCTLLPSGRIALVINAANVVRSATEIRSRQSIVQSKTAEQSRSKRILLADDSVTTRTLLKNILETAGYIVIDVADGQQAWNLLRDSATDKERAFDAVVCDVDMPRVNGFQLTAQARDHELTAEMPMVLVTARGTDEDKKQGLMVGADAYIVKGSFDQQNLLKTLSQLV